MSYIDQNLIPNEQVLHHVKPHWIVFTRGVLWLLITLILLFFGEVLPFLVYPIVGAMTLQKLLLVFTFVASLYFLIIAYFVWFSTEFAITNHRVLMKTGVLRTRTIEIFLDKIESVKIVQSLLGQMLNYGSIIITGTGGSHDPFFYLPYPQLFRKQIYERIEKK